MRLKHRRKTIHAGEVKLTYDPKDDSILLTPRGRASHPEEFPGRVVAPGTSEDRDSRELLFEAGVIPEVALASR